MLFGSMGLASNVLCGISRISGQWYEFRTIWVFVVEEYLLLSSKLM